MIDAKFLILLGKKIRDIRLGKGMTQSQLALQCKIEKGGMSRIEAGRVNITVLTLKKIGLALKTELNEFFSQ